MYLDSLVQGFQSVLLVLQELSCVTNAVCGMFKAMVGPILRKYWLKLTINWTPYHDWIRFRTAKGFETDFFSNSLNSFHIGC